MNEWKHELWPFQTCFLPNWSTRRWVLGWLNGEGEAPRCFVLEEMPTRVSFGGIRISFVMLDSASSLHAPTGSHTWGAWEVVPGSSSPIFSSGQQACGLSSTVWCWSLVQRSSVLCSLSLGTWCSVRYLHPCPFPCNFYQVFCEILNWPTL